MCSSVDLPQPEGPMIDTNCPSLEREVDAVDRGRLHDVSAVDLLQVLGFDDHCLVPAWLSDCFAVNFSSSTSL